MRNNLIDPLPNYVIFSRTITARDTTALVVLPCLE